MISTCYHNRYIIKGVHATTYLIAEYVICSVSLSKLWTSHLIYCILYIFDRNNYACAIVSCIDSHDCKPRTKVLCNLHADEVHVANYKHDDSFKHIRMK